MKELDTFQLDRVSGGDDPTKIISTPSPIFNIPYNVGAPPNIVTITSPTGVVTTVWVNAPPGGYFASPLGDWNAPVGPPVA